MRYRNFSSCTYRQKKEDKVHITLNRTREGDKEILILKDWGCFVRLFVRQNPRKYSESTQDKQENKENMHKVHIISYGYARTGDRIPVTPCLSNLYMVSFLPTEQGTMLK